MSDLIKKSEVVKAVERIHFNVIGLRSGKGVLAEFAKRFMEAVIDTIKEQPTVEVKEVVHGYVKTVVGKMGVMHQECSACGNALEWKAYPNYCDECGAKLDGADMRTSAE